MKLLLITLLFPVIGMGQTVGELRFDTSITFVTAPKVEVFKPMSFTQPIGHSTIKWSSLSAKGKRQVHYLMYHAGEKKRWCKYGLKIKCRRRQ